MSISNVDTFRAKIAAGKTCIGFVVTLSDLTVSEMAGDLGYDFTWIDMEHAPHTLESALGHIIATRGTGCAPFVRVPWNEPGILKPVLDLAPAGVIIPMVNSVAEAEAAVAACRYPPTGRRGCGVRRATRYGQVPFAQYLKDSEHEPMVIVQIEHIDAVRNLDAILRVPGIDSVCIGPCDLSGSLGKLNELDDPEVCRVLEKACRKVRGAGMMLGTAGGPLEVWLDRGVQWIALGSDCGGIIMQSQSILTHARELEQRRGGTATGGRRRTTRKG
jgi:2-keto-3-deoxy-L-rhamnonate aldolase RhmA